MGITFQKVDGEATTAQVQEILVLIRSIQGASSLWSTAYLQRLAKARPYLAIEARSQTSKLAGISIVHSVDAINPLILNEPHIFLRRLVVASDFRRSGIGRRLLRQTATECSTDPRFAKFAKIGWQTNRRNADGLEFFSQFGFEAIGSLSVGSHIDEIFSMDMDQFLGKIL